MSYQPQKLQKLVRLIEQHAPLEGINPTPINNLGTYKSSGQQARHSVMDIPAIIVVGQGRKFSYIGEQQFDYRLGQVLIGFYPIPAEMEIVEATPDVPFLLAGIGLDLGRMADLLLRIDRVKTTTTKSVSVDPSAIFAIELSDRVLDPFIRLFELLADPDDAAILGEAVIDEIYYRLLSGERGDELRALLEQKGKIQRISKAVNYIHSNLDQPVSVERLADIVHMSQTAFYLNFKEVMQLSPLQYAKSVKLFKAQRLIKEGKRVNEASYLVGYNNQAQFSREYKRQFGFTPSATVAQT